jgi:hypothetical protein
MSVAAFGAGDHMAGTDMLFFINKFSSLAFNPFTAFRQRY